MPKVFECTYVNKKYFKDPLELNTVAIPSPLDMRNLVIRPEIVIEHPPFVNSNLEPRIEAPYILHWMRKKVGI